MTTQLQYCIDLLEVLLRRHFENISRSVESREEIQGLYRQAALNIIQELPVFWDGRPPLSWYRYIHELESDIERLSKTLEDRINGVDQKLHLLQDTLDRRLDEGPVCRWRSNEADETFLHFIASGGPSREAQRAGKAEADKNLASWLTDAKEVICIDPYLFKRSQDGTETGEQTLERDNAYADALLKVLGKDKHVKFIYRGNTTTASGGVKVSPAIANRMESELPQTGLKATFHVVEELHDRVWLKRDGHGHWTGKVIGTSRDGIGKRPTYIIDMPDSDYLDYRKYVDYLIRGSQANHQRPLNFKRPAKRK